MPIINNGKPVSITDGEFKGATGVVVGYHNHDPITYAVQLDKSVTKTVRNEADLGGGKKSMTEEEVTFSRIEVPEAAVTAGAQNVHQSGQPQLGPATGNQPS